MNESYLQCRLKGECSGCAWIDLPYETQLAYKREQMLELLAMTRLGEAPSVTMVSAGAFRLRDRADLTWSRSSNGLSLGLYDFTRSKVVDMEQCPQMSSELEHWLELFRQNPPPDIDKGSVRLRVAPDGTRGVWLDLANLDVKRLLTQATWLEWLSGIAIVEIGQRFKPFKEDRGTLRLAGEIEPRPWFETYLAPNLDPCPLYGVIGSFTQPGRATNRALISELLEIVKALPKKGRALELFSGLGNLTLPLASAGFTVTAFENDPVATACFERTLGELPKLAARIHHGRKDLYAKSNGLPELKDFDLLVVDPPRSGLRNVATHIEATAPDALPAALIYVSCFGESMVDDLERLVQAGYRLKKIIGVDQFAQSPHCEWIAELRR